MRCGSMWVKEAAITGETNETEDWRGRRQPQRNHPDNYRYDQKWSRRNSGAIAWIKEAAEESEERHVAQETEGAETLQLGISNPRNADEAEDSKQAGVPWTTIKRQ